MKQDFIYYRVVVVLLLITTFFLFCKKNCTDDTPPVLSVPFVDVTKTRTLLPFGILLNMSTGALNPAYEIILTDTTLNVVASLQFTVERIEKNPAPQTDYAVMGKTSSHSKYKIEYDHIVNVAVHEGQVLQPGDLIGRIGEGGRTELQINKCLDDRDNGNYDAICPSTFGTTAFNQAFEQARLLSNSRSGRSDTTTCVKQTVKP
jgi:hypothetical protein